jgi:hypothetical protein
MLRSAFIEKLYDDGSSKTKSDMRRIAKHLKSENRVWSYVGRFITGFAMVEYEVNQLCMELLGGNDAVRHLLTYSLDLRKKLDLLKVMFESQGVDVSKTFSAIHELHDLRNIVAHWPFSEEEGGLWCDFIDKQGKTTFPRAKDNVINYSEFDSYDSKASELYEKLENLMHLVTPISDASDDLQHRIEEAISLSENVVRIKHRLQKDDEVESGD